MASGSAELVAFLLVISGWVLVSSTLPTDYWKVSSIDGTVITTATFWANLWKTCVTDSTGVSNCKDFPSMLALDGSEQTKSRIACLAGLIFILCGLCAMTSCSLYANRITVEFFDPLYVAQKYELGAALFIGWAGSSLCIIGGSIFCFSLVKDNKNRRVGYAYNTAASAISTRTKAYNDSTDFKAPNASPKHFDKNAYV
ncbi:PREDICTED: claudin-10 isoform X2 [Gekko japonicus]|uniref:Claudin n=1 Tax=Gekko japonicus TaxID=146911 RepID=A0ABM1KFY4_GEKJA|nr:PREDICTED: claudin-10 isoform X2 [Gekko japonicus]